VAFAGVLLVAALASAEAPGERDGSDRKVGPPAPDSPEAKKAEPFRVPGDAVLMLYEHLGDVLRGSPKLILVTPEKWKEIQDELARARARTPMEETPSTQNEIKIKGRVEGNSAELHVTFTFTTDRPNVLVLLGCDQAAADGVAMDGHSCDFRQIDGGFGVRVKDADTHTLTLDLHVPVQTLANASTRVIRLNLPRSPATSFELALPAGAKDVRLGEKLALAERFLTFKDGVAGGRLGTDDKTLELIWKVAGAAGNPAPEARAEVQVRVEERKTTTEAKLTLQPHGGPVQRWRLLLPPKAEVKVALDESRYQLRTDAANPALRILTLTDPGEDPVVVTAMLMGEALKPNVATPVGPFLVLGATVQKGDLVVSSTAPGLRVEGRLRGKGERRELTPEERRQDGVEAFRYEPPTPPERGAINLGALAILELEGEVMRRAVEARSLSHELKLVRDEDGGWRWRVTTTIGARALWPGADRLTLQLPSEWEYDERSAAAPDKRVRSVDYDAERREVVYRLNKGGVDALDPFNLTCKALGPKATEVGAAELRLPQLLDAVERGAQSATASAPDEIELIPVDDPLLELTEKTEHRLTWRPGPAGDRLPDRIRLDWKPSRVETKATSEVDVTLTAHQAQVQQTFRVTFPRDTLQLTLLIPEGLGDRFGVEGGGTLAPAGEDARTRRVDLRAAAGKEHVLTLKYVWRLPSGGGVPPIVRLPLIRLGSSTKAAAKVRVWAEVGRVPAAEGVDWSEQAVEEVKGRDSLPVLVFASAPMRDYFTLRLAPSADAAATVLVDRSLIRVEAVEGGGFDYRVRYRLRRLATSYLDLEMPAPVAGIGLHASLNGDGVTTEVVDDVPSAEKGRVVRLRLAPQLVKPGDVLEVRYQLAGRGWLLQTTLNPPVLRGEAERTPARWLVTPPPSWVVLAPESDVGRTWARRGWLLAPRRTTTPGDLERWFLERDPPPAEKAESETPPLVFSAVSGQALTVTHAPQAVWLLICSAGLVAIGLGFFLAARPGASGRTPFWVWPGLVVLASGVAVCALLWPDASAAAAYGAEPGAAVLLFAALVQWALHTRYRRQIVFLPSFSRSRGGSSVSRKGSKPPGEPSTVDAPHGAGSNWPTGEPSGA
jgi:hypothetical protein